MKVAGLTGALLDYWVAKALGLKPEFFGSPRKNVVGIVGGVPPEFELDGSNFDCFMPSTNWEQGGQLLEREGISIARRGDAIHRDWKASMKISARSGVGGGPWNGPSPLIAAMRAYVASKFGDEVDEK